jgi:hypothetical protein
MRKDNEKMRASFFGRLKTHSRKKKDTVSSGSVLKNSAKRVKNKEERKTLSRVNSTMEQNRSQ